MKKLFAMVMICIAQMTLLPSFLHAQRMELGGFIGGSNYLGDLTRSVSLNETHLSYGLMFRYNLNPFYTVQAGVYDATISGSDANQKDAQLQLRNLSFQSTIYEVNAQFQYNILGFHPGLGGRKFSPFVFAGVSGFYHDPKALYGGQWVDLQPLGTEGQGTALSNRKPYSKFQVAIPVGGGIKYELAKVVNIGLELGFRKTFTDYLDDVSTNYVDPAALESQNGITAAALADRSGELGGENLFAAGDPRGNSKMKDWYMLAGLDVTFNLDGGSGGGGHSHGRMAGGRGGKGRGDQACYPF